MQRAVAHAPVTTGARLGDIFLEWAVRHAQEQLGHYFDNANVLFFSGSAHRKLATTFSEYTGNLLFADPLLQLGIPKLLTRSTRSICTRAARTTSWRGSRPAHCRHRPGAVVAVGAAQGLPEGDRGRRSGARVDAFGIEELAGKTVVTATVNEERMARFRDKGVAMVLDAAPTMHGHALAPELLDAMILAATGKAADEILDDDYLEIIAGLEAQPRIVYPNGFRRTNRFAFVIHPLAGVLQGRQARRDAVARLTTGVHGFAREAARVRAAVRLLAGRGHPVADRRRGRGLVDLGRRHAQGDPGAQPRVHVPAPARRRRMAKRLGAQIMGLGAFTKVVGDAGVTVARRASLPITTGNSYSASARSGPPTTRCCASA